MESINNIKEEDKNNYAPCKNCKNIIRKKLRRCPYCGILNPTVTVKEIMVTMIIMVIVLYIVTSFIK